MKSQLRVLAIIPARGGSKGLPGKNIRPLAGIPLIGHTIQFAKMCPQIDRCIVSTDSNEVAGTARQLGSDVPFMRPAELAQDDTPMWPVLRHALSRMEEIDGQPYDLVLQLDPTSPARDPSDVTGALERLEACPEADGVIGVSLPHFNPQWVCVVEKDGWMTDLMDQGAGFGRRQDVPPVYRINGSLYVWRAQFMKDHPEDWRKPGHYVMYEIPESRAMSIDTIEEFQRTEVLVEHGLINFPWLQPTQSPA